jgi:ABC-type multidrug transport system ATPase subunit
MTTNNTTTILGTSIEALGIFVVSSIDLHYLYTSMQINLTNVSKRYNRDWIFRNFSYQFTTQKKYAITGPNGSGKSTLLQIIAGAISHNEGGIEYLISNKQCQPEEAYKHLSLAAPYFELVEEMTAKEFLSFHSHFKPLQIPINKIIELAGLEKAATKQIRYYSSGMKQRLKLAQVFFSNVPVLLLDEPTVNLDEEGVNLYLHLINEHTKDKLAIISSNDKQEYAFCDEIIDMEAYK